MPSDIEQFAEQFKKTLHALEESGDVGPMAELFADDATLCAVPHQREHHGRDGARAFWEEYLHPFGTIRSDFSYTAADGRLVILEWTGRGTGTRGGEIEYDGCSLLEVEDGKIKRFRTFYDSAAFVPAGVAGR